MVAVGGNGGGEVKIGSPLVINAKVTGEIVSQARAKSISLQEEKDVRELIAGSTVTASIETTLKITAIEA